MKNLSKFAKLNMQPSPPAMIGDRKASQEVYDMLRAATPGQAMRWRVGSRR